jgi:hypothetical protein
MASSSTFLCHCLDAGQAVSKVHALLYICNYALQKKYIYAIIYYVFIYTHTHIYIYIYIYIYVYLHLLAADKGGVWHSRYVW